MDVGCENDVEFLEFARPFFNGQVKGLEPWLEGIDKTNDQEQDYQDGAGHEQVMFERQGLPGIRNERDDGVGQPHQVDGHDDQQEVKKSRQPEGSDPGKNVRNNRKVYPFQYPGDNIGCRQENEYDFKPAPARRSCRKSLYAAAVNVEVQQGINRDDDGEEYQELNVAHILWIIKQENNWNIKKLIWFTGERAYQSFFHSVPV